MSPGSIRHPVGAFSTHSKIAYSLHPARFFARSRRVRLRRAGRRNVKKDGSDTDKPLVSPKIVVGLVFAAVALAFTYLGNGPTDGEGQIAGVDPAQAETDALHAAQDKMIQREMEAEKAQLR